VQLMRGVSSYHNHRSQARRFSPARRRHRKQ
jgi:hypothetical protein